MTEEQRDKIVEAALAMVSEHGEPRGDYNGYGRLYKSVLAIKPGYCVRAVDRCGNVSSQHNVVSLTVEGAQVNLADFEQHRKP